LTPDDVLHGFEAGAALQGPVVIYDDDHYYMANALAADLAKKGLEVHLVSPAAMIGGWSLHTLEYPRMLSEMTHLGVEMHPNATAVEWTGEGLRVQRSDTGVALPLITAKTLVFAGLREPDVTLSKALRDKGIAHRLIGDAEVPGPIQAAVYSGHRHARELLGREPEDRIFRRERPIVFDPD
ncbi:MAG: hypothetical protein ACPG40_06360, partial [Alphaproteobacteria bacterium]